MLAIYESEFLKINIPFFIYFRPLPKDLTCFLLLAKMSEEEETRIVAVASCAHRVNVISHGDFIDPKPQAIKKRKWSSAAPDWRKACNGLNLEGEYYQN
ncbi:hypothetical protein [endosymbiont GvMRE of Glomus versiforme]|uniref:hypothetical protein n=1 Tax=endosymbiont GvMRE of Glomus versiforme TaxID=2039283 RepID=UPI0011C37B9C|nr:hypothetical protein [endosymbiont GvMRE of Glomus versiforme]